VNIGQSSSIIVGLCPAFGRADQVLDDLMVCPMCAPLAP
jgi:hypothetical protein